MSIFMQLKPIIIDHYKHHTSTSTELNQINRASNVLCHHMNKTLAMLDNMPEEQKYMYSVFKNMYNEYLSEAKLDSLGIKDFIISINDLNNRDLYRFGHHLYYTASNHYHN